MTWAVKRDSLALWAMQALEARIPYVWGGRSMAGLDCSGFVSFPLWVLSSGGIDLRATHNTDKFWTSFPRVELPEPGDVALYRGANSTGPDDVEHAMLCVGSGVVVGQAHGGRANTTREFSLERGHWTKAKPMTYRSDLAGFVRLPLAR